MYAALYALEGFLKIHVGSACDSHFTSVCRVVGRRSREHGTAFVNTIDNVKMYNGPKSFPLCIGSGPAESETSVDVASKLAFANAALNW